ncbi:MAG: hypothetical protein ACF8QF_05435 [Phycisphaerales bacterium]
MPVALLHPAPADAPPGVAGVVRTGDETIAWWLERAALGGEAEAFDALLVHEEAPRLLMAWSGGLGDGLFDRSPRTWMTPGRDALSDACERLSPLLEGAGRRLLLRTHCRHVLSDAPACAAFAKARAGGPLAVALDPASMLESSMLGGVEDHLERLFALAAPHAEAIVAMQVVPPSGADPDALPRAARTGVFDSARYGELLRSRPDQLTIVAGPDPAGLAADLGLARPG